MTPRFTLSSPPTSPSHKLLENPPVQYAVYPVEEKDVEWHEDKGMYSSLPSLIDYIAHYGSHLGFNREDDQIDRGWTPVPLRARFWIPLVIFMIFLAIGLEVALYFSNKNKGITTQFGIWSIN